MKGFRNREIPVLYKNAGGVSVIDTGVFVRHKIMKPTLTYSHGQRPWDSKLLRQRTFLPLNWLVLNQGRAIGPSQGRPYRPLGTGAVTTPIRHQGYSRADKIPVAAIAAGTSLSSAPGFVPLTTVRTGLAGVSGINIFYQDPCQCGFVLDKLLQAIKTPGLEALAVFTTCPCRAAYIGELLQLNGFYIVLDCKVDDLPTNLVVLVAHPPLFLVAGAPDGIELFLLTQFFPAGFITAAHLLVPAAVAHELYLPAAGLADGGAEHPQVNPHLLVTVAGIRFRLLIGDLGNQLFAFPGEPERSQLMSLQAPKSLCRNHSLDEDPGTLSIPNRKRDPVWLDDVVLVVPDRHRFLEYGETLRLPIAIPCTLCIQEALIFQRRRQGRPYIPGGHLRHTPKCKGVIHHVIDQPDILLQGTLDQSLLFRGRPQFKF